ncbi:kelch-like protein 18 [Oppia nitens]|uniref:kelch-like protein 18 n=1 Tax=Oppia nitens TaxID=1686743 RepID=UPI0023DB7772|nr:kelch-like protein 18 [Oppia nitens]
MRYMTTKREDFGLVSNDSKLYAIGGYNGQITNSVEAYDIKTNTWKLVSSMNLLRYKFDAVLANNHIYVCGGYNGEILKSCEYYSDISNKWYFTKPMTIERDSLALVSHDGLIYAMGGYNENGYLNSMEMFDTTTVHWTFKANMTSTRGNFGSASFMGKIYI